MPLKIQTYRKVLARLVPHQYAMARSRLSGATMIIAWSTICNSFPVLGMSSAWYPATTWTSLKLKILKKYQNQRWCCVFVCWEFTPSIVVFCNFCQVVISQVVGGRGRLFVCCVFVVFVKKLQPSHDR